MAPGDDLSIALGRALQELRRERGLSQEALSFEGGVHRTTVGRIERAERVPTVVALHAIATALGVSMAELFRRVERHLG